MPVGEYVTFARDDVLPSYWPNNLQKFLSSAVVNFRLRQVAGSETTVEVPASGSEASAIALNGPIRFNTATVSRAHPGGAAGTYPVFVTAKANDIRNAPLPYSDFTDYSFALDIEAPGGTPAIVAGVVDMYRQVGEVVWDGVRITAVRQLVGTERVTDPVAPTATTPEETPLRVIGAAAQTGDYLRVETSAGGSLLKLDSAGVLRGAGDIRANDGGVAQVALSSNAGAAAVAFGSAADASIYRSGAGLLRTDSGVQLGVNAVPPAGALYALSDVIARQGATTQALLGSVGGAAGIQLEGDTDLTRSGAGVLRTSGQINAVGGYQVNGVALAASHLSNGVTGSGAVVLATSPTITTPTIGGGGKTALVISDSGAQSSGLTIGGDTNLYRAAADSLKTDDQMTAALGYRIGAPLSGGVTYQSQQVAADVVLRNLLLAADANPAFAVLGDGTHQWGAGGASAVDTNLYRSTAGQLRTDGQLTATSSIYAAVNSANQVFIGSVGGSPGLSFGSGSDVTLSRPAAGQITIQGAGAATGTLHRVQAMASQAGNIFEVTNSTGGTPYLRVSSGGSVVVNSKLYVGTSADNAFTRPAAGTMQLQAEGAATATTLLLKQVGSQTGDVFQVQDSTANVLTAIEAAGTHRSNLTALVSAFRNFLVSTDANPAFNIRGDGRVQWGAGAALAVDTNLYRASADTLKTDDTLQSALDITARSGVTGQVRVGSDGVTNSTITFGTAEDTNLYRSAADTLKTDDAVISASKFWVGSAAAVPAGTRAYGAAVTAANMFAGTYLASADANPAWRVLGDGTVGWGLGGASAVDTTLSRSAAAVLKANQSFHVATDFRHLGANLGFYNVAAVARAAAMTNNSGLVGSSTLPASFTLSDLAKFVLALYANVQATGLVG